MKWINKAWNLINGFKRIAGWVFFSTGEMVRLCNSVGWLTQYEETATILIYFGIVLAGIGSAHAIRKRKNGGCK